MTRSLYAEPAYYGMMFEERVDDVEFYFHVCRGAGTVLEYGVGTGRVALPLARAGCEVVGIDLAPEMLDELARRATAEPPAVRTRLSWLQGDARTAQLGRRFDRVLCPFNGIAHHGRRDELAAFLARVHEHLAPGGRFVFDVWIPHPRVLAEEKTETPWFADPRTGDRVRAVESFEYEPLTQMLTTLLTLTSHDDAKPVEVLQTTLRQFFPEETLALLDRHGFDVEWRTSTFAIPSDTPRDAAMEESRGIHGDMLAYVCRARP